MRSNSESIPLLLYFEDEHESAERIARAGNLSLLPIERHRFPDGELRLRLPERLPAQLSLLRSLHMPNEKLLELLLAAQTARQSGVSQLTLVAPYLAYMRQDIAFQPGEVISQRVVGQFLASLFDAVITVDPHLHRVAALHEAVPAANTLVLSAAAPLSDLLAARRPAALLVGPDEESAQWVARAGARHGFDHAVCRKVRHGDRSVQIELPQIAIAGRQVVLLDDVASTGHTLARAARLLLLAGADSVDVAVTHALFEAGAVALLQEAGVSEIWSTDCVPHASNAVSMAAPIAQALRQIRAAAPGDYRH
ncbi:MAG: ribose-phosphate diphosphokinase [Rhodoferax sp.]